MATAGCRLASKGAAAAIEYHYDEIDGMWGRRKEDLAAMVPQLITEFLGEFEQYESCIPR